MSSQTVDQIKDRLDIVDVVESYVKLARAGINLKAKCPFHNERTPSFFVSPQRQTYHCFGCNRGGDIFSFIEEIEGVDFKGALQILADRAGVEITSFDRKKKDEKEKLYNVLEDATLYFQINLTKNKQALAYLYGRGLRAHTLKSFRIGFAKDAWNEMHGYLSNKGHSDEVIEKAGLSIKREGKNEYYDRFRSRVMFPVFDSAGRVIAFSGRVFGDKSGDAGKYINTPETTLFNKSRVLYGYNKAKGYLRKKENCIVVEGQMDLLLSYQEGFVNTVALSGTALTRDHVKIVHRLTDTFILAFDGDEAGIRALLRSSHVALSLGMNVTALALPEGKDPADILSEGKEKWDNALKNAKHVVDFYLEHVRNREKDKRSFRLAVSKEVLPLVKRISNKIDQSHFISRVSDTISVPETSVREELEKIEFSDEELFKEAEDSSTLQEKSVDIPVRTRKDIVADRIYSILLMKEKEGEPLLGRQRLLRSTVPDMNFKKHDTETQLFLAETLIQDSSDIESELDELFAELDKEVLKERFKDVMDNLRKAELQGDQKKVATLLKECQELSQKLATY